MRSEDIGIQVREALRFCWLDSGTKRQSINRVVT